MSDHIIPDRLLIILNNLTFISEVPIGQKISFSGMCYIDQNDWYQRFLKYWRGEDCSSVVQRIGRIINDSMEAYDIYKDTIHEDILVQKLKKAVIGISNLKETYASLRRTSKYNLDTILTNLDKFLETVTDPERSDTRSNTGSFESSISET